MDHESSSVQRGVSESELPLLEDLRMTAKKRWPPSTDIEQTAINGT